MPVPTPAPAASTMSPVAASSLLDCNKAIAAAPPKEQDIVVVGVMALGGSGSGQVLQTSRSGEPDAAGRLYAKTGCT